MTDRDRLAADLAEQLDDDRPWVTTMADRLIALGWTRLDEERLARALGVAGDAEGMHYWCKEIDGCGLYSDGRDFAAAIAKAYREDTDAN